MEFVFASHSFDVWENWTLEGSIDEWRLVNCRNPSVSSARYPYKFIILFMFMTHIRTGMRFKWFPFDYFANIIADCIYDSVFPKQIKYYRRMLLMTNFVSPLLLWLSWFFYWHKENRIYLFSCLCIYDALVFWQFRFSYEHYTMQTLNWDWFFHYCM
jgi:hypothetical protein